MAVVVVDDEEMIRTLVTRVLSRRGADVHAFGSGDEALAWIEENREAVACLVSDITMPGGVDGIGLARHLGQDRPGVPVILMSGDDEALRRARSVGAVVYLLAKPFELDELTAAVDAVMGAAKPVPPKPSRPGIPAVRLVDIMPVLRRAAGEAIRSKHQHIGSEQLALAALGGPDGLEAMALEASVDSTQLRPALEGCCHSPEWDREPTITPRSTRMLAIASQMALLDRAEEVRPIHLIAALLGEPDAVAWRGLLAAGLSPLEVASGVNRRRKAMA